MVPSPSESAGHLLETAPLEPLGYLRNASNHTLLVRADGVHAVYKPRAGERPLWDFPQGTLCQREVAAWVVSEALGWELVPPTVLREGPFGIGSVQLFVPHDPEEHYFTLVADPAFHDQLARIAVYDLLINNADRKGSHVLRADGSDHLVAIDHGVTFHTQTKLRTVIWDLAEYPIPAEVRGDVQRLAAELAAPEPDLRQRLGTLLNPAEVEALRRRAAAVARLECLPQVPADRRPYPWPPL